MKGLKRLAVLGLFLLCAGAALAANDQKEERQSDLWLKAKLVTTYTLNEHLNPFKLDVDIKNGVAHLGGTVDSDAERDLAVEIAKGIDGIKEVKEDIKVEPGATAGKDRQESTFYRTVEDATVTAKVKSKLLWNRNTHGLAINVTTEKGRVTLEGTVDSKVQKDLAAQLAKNTSGVDRVKNALEVVSQKEKKEAVKEERKNTVESMESKARDIWITTKVKSLLLYSKEADGADIEVSTADQIVTLKGTVVNQEQLEKVRNLVGDVVGVKKVRSELTVEKG